MIVCPYNRDFIISKVLVHNLTFMSKFNIYYIHIFIRTFYLSILPVYLVDICLRVSIVLFKIHFFFLGINSQKLVISFSTIAFFMFFEEDCFVFTLHLCQFWIKSYVFLLKKIWKSTEIKRTFTAAWKGQMTINKSYLLGQISYLFGRISYLFVRIMICSYE